MHSLLEQTDSIANTHSGGMERGSAWREAVNLLASTSADQLILYCILGKVLLYLGVRFT